MSALELGQTLQLDDGSYELMQRQSNFVRLRHCLTGAALDIHLNELARRLTGKSACDLRPPRLLDEIASPGRMRAEQWAGHIHEILHGTHPDFDRTLPEYSLERKLEERVQQKIADLAREGRPTSRATIMRKIRDYRTDGTAGLIDGRSFRKHGPLDRVDPRVLDALISVIAEQARKSTGTKSRLIIETRKELMRRHAGEVPQLPSIASMYRYIDILDAGRQTTGSAKNRRSRANRPDRTFGKNHERLPGAEIQIDTNTMDILIDTAEGPKRPRLTIMLDVATRSILAYTFRLEATKSIDHVALIALALTPPENRPSRRDWRARISAHFPAINLLDEQAHIEAERTRPFVFPRRLMMDNGKDYIGSTFRSALQKFGIDLTLSAPHTPTDKAIVERTFRSINTLFLQHLPGYVAHSPEYRGHKPEDDDLLNLWALQELFDDWVLTTWQNRPHEGLQDFMQPTICYTPNEMLTRAAQLTAPLQLPLTEQDYIELLPTKYRAIGDVGVQLTNRYYDSPDLHPLRHTKSSYPTHGGKWPVKYDPYNPLTIWVKTNDGYIECGDRNQDGTLQPYSADLFPDERADIARLGSDLAGVPLHREIEPAPVLAPSSYPEDDDTDALVLTSFNPDED